MPKKDKWIIIAIYMLIMFIIASWIIYAFYGQQLIKEMYLGGSLTFFNITNEFSRYWSLAEFELMAKYVLIICTLLVVISSIFYFFRSQLLETSIQFSGNKSIDEIRQGVFSWCILLGCSWACFFSLLTHSWEGHWYVIKDVMDFSTPIPFLNHRVLFVLIAKALKVIFPNLLNLWCYFISQLISIVLALYFIKKWAELFIVKQLAFIAQLLLTCMLIPTFIYYTFYDIGTVLFYTLSLYLLFQRHFLWYLFVFILATFNHEISLFLIFIYTAIYIDSDMKKPMFWMLLFIQLILYAAVKGILFYCFPVTASCEGGKVWVNIIYLLRWQGLFSWCVFTLIFWYAIAALGIKHAPKKLRRCLILFPLLAIMTLFVGQYNEARNFNAFIPIAIALILCFISSLLQKKEI